MIHHAMACLHSRFLVRAAITGRSGKIFHAKLPMRKIISNFRRARNDTVQPIRYACPDNSRHRRSRAKIFQISAKQSILPCPFCIFHVNPRRRHTHRRIFLLSGARVDICNAIPSDSACLREIRAIDSFRRNRPSIVFISQMSFGRKRRDSLLHLKNIATPPPAIKFSPA